MIQSAYQPLTKLQRNIFIFGCAMVKKKTGKGDDVTFLKAFFSFPTVVNENK